MAMATAMAEKQKKWIFWREQRHKNCYCCFGWAVYAHGHVIWACGYSVSLNWQDVFLTVWLISRLIESGERERQGEMEIRKRKGTQGHAYGGVL
jgi:hypothetical protein